MVIKKKPVARRVYNAHIAIKLNAEKNEKNSSDPHIQQEFLFWVAAVSEFVIKISSNQNYSLTLSLS